ncbi:unnamed protein product, partial [Nesidiocoris tenuis]
MPTTMDEVLAAITAQNQSITQLIGQMQQQTVATSQVSQRADPPNRGYHGIHFERYDETVETFSDYLDRLSAFFKTQNVPKQSEADVFVSSLSAKHHTLLKSLIYPARCSEKSFDELKKTLQDHLSPAPLVIPSRHAFLNRKQQEGESVAQYLASLRKLATNCKYDASMLNTMLRDAFVSGLRSKAMLDRLFEEDDVDLKRTMELASAIERACEGTTEVLHQVTPPAQAVHKIKFHKRKPQPQSRPLRKKSEKIICFKCGAKNSHKAPACTAKNLRCRFCSGEHDVSVCLKKRRASNVKLIRDLLYDSEYSDVDQLDDEYISDDDEFPFQEVRNVHHIESNKNHPPYHVTPRINGKPIEFELDSGSRSTILNMETLRKVAPTAEINSTHTVFRTYDGTKLTPAGRVKLSVEFQGKSKILSAFVVEGNYPLIFGRDWMDYFNISFTNVNILKNQDISIPKSSVGALVVRFANVFSDKVGAIKNYVCSLKLQNDATPVFRKARPVPLALRSKVEGEIDRLVQENILKRVESADWGTPVVPVVKPSGDVRLCGDYSCTLNQYVIIPQHPFPGFEEVFSSLTGGRHFSRLDVRSAFLHMPVCPETAKMLTINTHKGLYEPQRLMYGVSAAPTTWQRYVDQIFHPIECCVVHDDIILTGRTTEEHLQRLEQVLTVCENNGIHLNHAKCRFFEEEVTFLGYRVDAHGVHKTNEKVAAVLNAKRPENAKMVKAFLGLVTFYGRFFPQLATCARPLYNLTKKGVEFKWDRDCEVSFEKIKREIASDRVLTHYNPSLPITLATDASPYGLGAVLSNVVDGKELPVAFASRTLSDTEKNYSQIDKEALSIKWGVFKFFHYLYNQRFTLITDHRPLVQIFGSKNKLPLLSATRMLHYALQLQIFNFDVKYRKSELHGNADALSRFPTTSEELQHMPQDEATILQLRQWETLPVTPQQVARATAHDPELKQILEALRMGTSLGEGDLKFSIHQDCVFNGIRLYVPTALRARVLSELHDGHLGIVKMKALARSYVFWPKLDKDLENLVRSCQECNLVARNPPRVSVHQWEKACHPWHRIHADFAGPFQGHLFLLVVDSYSKWPEVFLVRTTNSAETIKHLEGLFTRFGYPVIIVTDNDTDFTSFEFQNFVKQYNIRHTTGAPFHPATNGQVERFVSTMKTGLRRLCGAPGTIQDRLNRLLLSYRRAPHPTTGRSPASLMLGRELRTMLDVMRPSLLGELQRDVNRPAVSKKFDPGERVAIRVYANPNKKWQFGSVLNRDGELNYSIQVGSDIVRRHVDQMRSVSKSIRPTEVPPIRKSLPHDIPARNSVPPPLPDPSPRTRRSTIGPAIRASQGLSSESAPDRPLDAAPSTPPRTSLGPLEPGPVEDATAQDGIRRSQRNRRIPDRLQY